MIPDCDGQTVRQTESIMAKTALCIASYADALSKTDQYLTEVVKHGFTKICVTASFFPGLPFQSSAYVIIKLRNCSVTYFLRSTRCIILVRELNTGSLFQTQSAVRCVLLAAPSTF